MNYYNKIMDLIEQANKLLESNNIMNSDEFRIWHSGVKRVLSDCFGEKSMQFRQFNNRLFDASAKILNSNCDYSKYRISDIKVTMSELKEYADELKEDTNNIVNNETAKKIFLSHSSIDKKYADLIRSYLMDIGVKKDQLIYTSHPLHKIPMGKNIYEYLRDEIASGVLIVFLWSDDYLNSPACLAEMGAAWLTKSDFINVFVPNFDFNNEKFNQCPVDTKNMGLSIGNIEHCRAGLIELKNKVSQTLDIVVDEQELMYAIDQFITAVE